MPNVIVFPIEPCPAPRLCDFPDCCGGDCSLAAFARCKVCRIVPHCNDNTIAPRVRPATHIARLASNCSIDVLQTH